MHNGFLNVLKPPGMSSHDVVSFIRRIYGQKKVGHAGTLDPAAAGVLPIALGQGTRLLEYVTDASKTYRAELTLGYETDSGDDTGNIIRSSPFTMPEPDEINCVLQQFCGENKQTPPMYSAIKVNGTKLYELARKGVSIDIPERTIYIDSISLLDRQNSHFLFDVNCSKGTYIRTLCMDIGKKLNIPAVMSFLIRSRVGDFSLSAAYTLEEIQNDPLSAMQSIDSILNHIPVVYLNSSEAAAFRQGQKIRKDFTEDSITLLRIYDELKEFVGIGTYNKERLCIVPTKVISR